MEGTINYQQLLSSLLSSTVMCRLTMARTADSSFFVLFLEMGYSLVSDLDFTCSVGHNHSSLL